MIPRQLSDRVTINLIVVASCLMFAEGSRKVLRYLLPHSDFYAEGIYNTSVYNRTVIVPNYLTDGFVRRGLGGTIAALIPGGWITSAVLFTMLSAALLTGSLTIFLLLNRRSIAPGFLTYSLAVLLLSPQTFLAWSKDLARTDMLAASFVVLAASATLAARTSLAVFLMILGTMVHETALIFAVPLIAVLIFERRQQLPSNTLVVVPVLLFTGLAGVAAAQHFLSAPSQAIALEMLHAGPQRTDVLTFQSKLIAAYMAVGGLRGIQTAICSNTSFGPTYALNAVLGLCVVVLYARILLLRRAWLAFSIAVLLPLICLLVVASDTGRWICLAVLNAWLLGVSRARAAGPNASILWYDFAVGAALLAGLLVCGVTEYYRVNRLLGPLTSLTRPTAPLSGAAWLERCDPRWREVLPQPIAS